MESEKLALIIDPDPIHLDIMEGMLQEEMAVLLASSAAEAQEMVEYKQPHLILMERKLPDMDGYLLCKALKEKMGSSACAIIILAEVKDIYDKMEGFKHGCDDFLTKPFQVEELYRKIHLSIEMHEVQMRLKSRSEEASNVAQAAMKMGGELGAVLQFAEQSAESPDYEALGKLVIQTTQQFNLTCYVMFKSFLGENFVGCESDSPEEHVLAMCSDKERFVIMGEQMIVNHNTTSLLALNMPLEDEVRYSELKDTLGIIINIIEARAKSIENELRLAKARNGGLMKTIEVYQEKMVLIRESVAQHHTDISSITYAIENDVRDTCFALDLSEAQELDLLAKVDTSINRLKTSSEDLANIETHMSSVTLDLINMLEFDSGQDGEELG